MKEEITTDLQFTCPVCGSNHFGLVEAGTTVCTPILAVSADGQITWGDPIIESDNIEGSWYQCAYCHYKIEEDDDPITRDPDELVAWLRDNNGRAAEGSASDSIPKEGEPK